MSKEVDPVAMALYYLEQAEKSDDVTDRYYFQRQAELWLKVAMLEKVDRFINVFQVKRMSFHG